MAKKTLAELEAEIAELVAQGEESAAQLDIANQRITDLEAENTDLKSQASALNAKLTSIDLVGAVDEFDQEYAKEISAKVNAGLNKEQARNAVKAQVRHDKALAKKAAK